MKNIEITGCSPQKLTVYSSFTTWRYFAPITSAQTASARWRYKSAHCPATKCRDGCCWKCKCGKTVAPRVGSILERSHVTYEEAYNTVFSRAGSRDVLLGWITCWMAVILWSRDFCITSPACYLVIAMQDRILNPIQIGSVSPHIIVRWYHQ